MDKKKYTKRNAKRKDSIGGISRYIKSKKELSKSSSF